MPIQSCLFWSIGSKNSDAPHLVQKPRLTFSEEWYQVIFSEPWIVSAERGTSVLGRKCPVHFRHWIQWHASGEPSLPITSNFIAPQRQEPLCIAPPIRNDICSPNVLVKRRKRAQPFWVRWRRAAPERTWTRCMFIPQVWSPTLDFQQSHFSAPFWQ